MRDISIYSFFFNVRATSLLACGQGYTGLRPGVVRPVICSCDLLLIWKSGRSLVPRLLPSILPYLGDDSLRVVSFLDYSSRQSSPRIVECSFLALSYFLVHSQIFVPQICSFTRPTPRVPLTSTRLTTSFLGCSRSTSKGSTRPSLAHTVQLSH